MKFIHTADWQIGKPFVRIEDEKNRALLQQQRIDTVKKIGEVARDQDAAFVVVAGDLFDSNTPDKATVSGLCSAVGEMEIPVYVIPGNHDTGGPGTIYEQDFFLQEAGDLAPNMHVLLESRPIELETAILLPCPCIYKIGRDDPVKWLANNEIYETLPQGLPRIVIAHGSVMSFSGDSFPDGEDDDFSDVINLDFIPSEQVDYIALGDWHGTRQVHEKGWYSGTHEQDRYPRGEGYDAGNVLVVHVKRAVDPRVEKVHVGQNRWHSLEKNIHSDQQLHHLVDEIKGLTEGRVKRDLLRLAIKGSLSMKGLDRFNGLVETWKARFLELRLEKDLKIAPDDEDLQELLTRSDPMISAVAGRLFELIDQGSDEREQKVATLALMELYSAVAGGSKE